MLRDDMTHIKKDIEDLSAYYEQYRMKTLEIKQELEKETVDVEAIMRMLDDRNGLIKTIDELTKNHLQEVNSLREKAEISALIDRLNEQIGQIRILDKENQDLMKQRMNETKTEMDNVQKGKKTFRAYAQADYVRGSYFIDKRK